MPEKQILAKKTYVDNNLNNVVRNVNGVVSIPNTQVELSKKIVTTTEEDPDTHEEITTDEVVTESYLDKTKLHVEDSYASKTAEYGVNEITLNDSTITGITNNPSGNSSTLAVSQRALSNFKQVEANPVGQATADLTTIKIDNTIYELDAGTNVSITPTITEGTKIADYSIDGVNGELYTTDADNSVELTTAEYNDLPQSEKMNGTTYLLTDGRAGEDDLTPSMYLKSHGTEFIKTGVMPTEKIDYELEFFFDRDQVEDSSITGWHNQFGGNDGNTTNSILFSYNFSTHYLTFQKGNNPAFQDVFYKLGPHCVYKIVNKGGNHWINGVSQTNDFGTTSFTGTDNDIAIFGSNTSPSGGNGICLIRCKIYDNNVLIRDFIPNENNGTPCLYDQINNVYYTNQGTGSFEIGYIDDIITSNANENNQIDYSLIEQRTGQRWINGKPIYQKTIYYAGGSSGGRYNIPHGISNLDKLIYLEGFYTDSSGDNPHMILPRIATDGYHIGINSADNTYIAMTFDTVWGSRLTDVYITIRYTKTTE